MRRALVAAAVLAGVTALGAMPASGSHVVCGAVVTTDIRLTHDLVGCTGDGLEAGAAGITIDLGGFTISGDGGDAGVRVPAFKGVGNVTILNGTITGFADGVRADITSGNHISRLNVTGNDRGINLANVDDSVIEKNTVSASILDGIRVDGGSDGNVVQKNVLTDNVFGISVSNFSDNNLIAKNDLNGGSYGISVFSDSDGNVVEKNDVNGMTFEGIQIESQSDDTLVSKNTATDNGTDGILVEPAAGPFAGAPVGTILVKNTANGNGDDGIDVDSAATTVTKNTANDNGNLGVDAVAGVVDGGGNKATGNGDPDQCVGVVCG